MDSVPTALRDSRPSARAVWLALRADGPLSVAELERMLLFNRGTIRNALDDLDDRGLLDAREHPGDARRRLYDLADDGMAKDTT